MKRSESEQNRRKTSAGRVTGTRTPARRQAQKKARTPARKSLRSLSIAELIVLAEKDIRDGRIYGPFASMRELIEFDPFKTSK